MYSARDQLPRIFQANLSRFYDRIVAPGLAEMPVHPGIAVAEPVSMSEALDRAAARIDNYTANEAAKAYTLTIAALFERQLNIWAAAIQAESPVPKPKSMSFGALLTFCAAQAEIDLGKHGLADDLEQMFRVANVVRHGDGQSCDQLHARAPALWDGDPAGDLDLFPGPPTRSELLRIRDGDLARYIRAITTFWGLADPLPMAVTDPPY